MACQWVHWLLQLELFNVLVHTPSQAAVALVETRWTWRLMTCQCSKLPIGIWGPHCHGSGNLQNWNRDM
jgi:hypothetical protein